MKWRQGFIRLALVGFAVSSLGVSAVAEHSNYRPRIVAHRGANAQRPENTLAALRQAIAVGADVVEIDVRSSRDGVLLLLHDATLDRTTNGRGPVEQKTWSELKQLDAGAWFGAAYRGERIPTLAQALETCAGRIDVLLDLKGHGAEYARAVAEAVRAHGQAQRTIMGVHTVEQARTMRHLLPHARQLGFIASPQDIAPFMRLDVETIRLWPEWLARPGGRQAVDQVRRGGAKLQLNATTGTPRDILPLLQFRPDALLVDDPARLRATLDQWQSHAAQFATLRQHCTSSSALVTVVQWIAQQGAPTFLNRNYQMQKLPPELSGAPRVMFAGGQGDRVVLTFRKPTVVFAVFDYNTTGAWSFPEGHQPVEFGWQRVAPHAYRGTSNPTADGKPNYADVYARSFRSGERLEGLPQWWICLAIVTPEAARRVPGFSSASANAAAKPRPFLYEQWATHSRPLHVPRYHDHAQWQTWQQAMRKKFRDRLTFHYDAPTSIVKAGPPIQRDHFVQQQYRVRCGDRTIFRFFKLLPDTSNSPAERQPRRTIVCFMGHGTVSQILDQPKSYQHACAARYARQGYLVFAMENVGMQPGHDVHLELDRVLRLDGYGWYSLLFAHQQILLDYVFADPSVDTRHVGVTGVSTGGLLALSAIAMDPRVASASVQGIFGSMRVSFIRDRNRHCSCGAIPGLLPEFDLPEMALLAAPRPLHFSNATQDGFSPHEAERCIEQITPLYIQAGGKRPLLSVPAGHHEYAFAPALKFFQATLGNPRK